MKPEISVVIPVFHPSEVYLHDLFESLILQDIIDYEIIISDDSDSESLIFRVLPGSLRSKTRYVKNIAGHGIFKNLNNAIKNADTEYIQIFCQDDVMSSTLLSSNLACLKKHPECDMVFCHFDLISDTGVKSKFYRHDINFIPEVFGQDTANDLFLYFGCMPGNLSPVMIKKDLIHKIGLFNESLQYVADYEYWIRAGNATKICFNRGMHLYVRGHSKSASALLGTFKKYQENKTVLQYLIDNNTIPVPKKTLKRYVNLYVFRSVFSYSLRNLIATRTANISEIKEVFDGKPYSLWTSFLAFINPKPRKIRQLSKVMESIQ